MAPGRNPAHDDAPVNDGHYASFDERRAILDHEIASALPMASRRCALVHGSGPLGPLGARGRGFRGDAGEWLDTCPGHQQTVAAAPSREPS